jgi:putative phosphoesterase
MRIGLISDTHWPDYIEALPETLHEIFAGVDLILHAGDVGTLSVLDFLGKCGAPVVAIQGNDEECAATRAALPLQQLVSVEGDRILVVHGNRSNPQAEQAMRADDRWEPKFQYLADVGKQHAAAIVVSGHTHTCLWH